MIFFFIFFNIFFYHIIIQMALVNPRLEVMEKLIASKFVEKVGKESFYLNLEDAVLACQYSLRTSKPSNNEDTV